MLLWFSGTENWNAVFKATFWRVGFINMKAIREEAVMSASVIKCFCCWEVFK